MSRFNVDRFTKDLLIAVAGDFPEIQIRNADSTIVPVERVVDTKRALVVRVLPTRGEYTVEICSRGLSITTFYKWETLEFRYGFSPIQPRSINETSNAPLPDTTSYVIIEQLDVTVELFLLELQAADGNTPLELKILNEDKGLYVAQAYFKGDKPLRISIHGREKQTHEVIKGTSAEIIPQAKIQPRPVTATVEAIKLESNLVEFMSNVSMFCKVTGDPKPDIWWEDDNENRIKSEGVFFEWPSTYISYVTMDNATINTTIYCKCKNSEGESFLSTELFVHREFTFEVLQQPADTTIEYGSEGKLHCEVLAYPAATIKWYHNDSNIENNDNVEIVPDDNMLLIKKMTLDDTGEYKCEINNEVEERTITAVVDVSGLEAPIILVKETEYTLEPEDTIEVNCIVLNGNPTPEVSWKKLVDDELIDIEASDFITVEETTLKLLSAKGEHSGVYKCKATNIIGEDSKEVTIKVQYAPIIKNSDETKKVNLGESVQLECNVDAEPKAVVHWDLYQDDVIIAFDDRHYTDEQNTHSFIAQPYDSGSYHCIAENGVGRSERKVQVIVLEAPFIEPLDFKTLTARVGATILVTCNVSLGSPVPNTRWEFISPKSATTVLTRNTTTKLDLMLRNISKANEGSYQCVAENEMAPDSVKFYLKVL